MSTTFPLDFDQALELLTNASGPETIFGARRIGDDEQVRSEAQTLYRHLARLVHPDRRPDRLQDAADGFTRLTALWDTFNDAGSAARPLTITTRRSAYTLGDRFARGDLANLYDATLTPKTSPGDTSSDTQTVLLKMPRDPRNNDLLEAEARVLTHLAGEVDARYAAYLPQLVESFRHRDTVTGTDRRVNALAKLDGFYSLAQVGAAYPQGLDARDVAWMWRRTLVALGAVHRAGVVHGAVLPEHILIHPAQHGLVLTDFAYATTGEPIAAVVSRYRDSYPEEVLDKKRPGPGTDIAMATRVLTGLLTDHAPAPLRAFAAGCTLRALHFRPNDAWGLLRELDELLERLYGPRKFRPFTMPN